MKKFISVLTAGIILSCTCACDAVDNNGYIDAGVSDLGTFDFKQTVTDVELYGKKVSLNGKSDDLCSVFDLSNGVEYEGDDGTMFDLSYNGKFAGNVRLDCSPEADPKGKKILFVEIQNTVDMKLNGISFKSQIQDVITRFGAPSSTDDMFISYSGSGSQRIEFYRLSSSAKNIQYVDIYF